MLELVGSRFAGLAKLARESMIVGRLTASPKGLTARRIMNDEC